MPVLYKDRFVLIDERGVTLHRYLSPWKGDRQIPWERIIRVDELPLNRLTGKSRNWGPSLGMSARMRPQLWWLAWDDSRAVKETVIVLDTGERFKPAFTPEEPSRVLAVIRARTRVLET